MTLYVVRYQNGDFVSPGLRANEQGVFHVEGVSKTHAQVWSTYDTALRCTFTLEESGIHSTVEPANFTVDEIKARMEQLEIERWIIERQEKIFLDELQNLCTHPSVIAEECGGFAVRCLNCKEVLIAGTTKKDYLQFKSSYTGVLTEEF